MGFLGVHDGAMILGEKERGFGGGGRREGFGPSRIATRLEPLVHSIKVLQRESLPMRAQYEIELAARRLVWKSQMLHEPWGRRGRRNIQDIRDQRQIEDH